MYEEWREQYGERRILVREEKHRRRYRLDIARSEIDDEIEEEED